MALGNFIPQVWSARILEALHKETVYTDLFNRDYEGEITQKGDTVHIGQIGAVEIKAYTKDADIAAPDKAQADDQTLAVDQADYFNIAVDDVNAVQSALNLLDGATTEAGYGFADKTDQYLAGLLAAAAGSTIGTDTAPVAITEANAYKTIVQLKTALDKANCPKQGRICVVPAEFEAQMLLDSRFVAVGTDASNDRLENGTVYKAAGFTIRVSNNAPVSEQTVGSKEKVPVYTVLASCDRQGTFADQINKVEAYRPEKRFADAVKGLHVYGAKVLRPSIVAAAKVSF